MKSENVYEEFLSRKICLTYYSQDSEFFDDDNKKVIGKMKDEFGGIIIGQFIGLKPQMYSIKKLMVEKQKLLKEYILRQNLMNFKMFSLIKKLDKNEKNLS